MKQNAGEVHDTWVFTLSFICRQVDNTYAHVSD
jgi:hypothetical protein